MKMIFGRSGLVIVVSSRTRFGWPLSAWPHCAYQLLRLDRRRVHLDAEQSQGVAYGIGDGGRRSDGSPLPDPLDAERVERRRRVLVDDPHCRDVAGGRERVIHQ